MDSSLGRTIILTINKKNPFQDTQYGRVPVAHQWLTTVIPATQKTEIRMISIRS
jgi:hypothetical protein